METRPIPNTDLNVSPLCLGTMTFGTPVGEKEAISIVHWALDHDIHFIDTANMYEGYTRFLGSPGGVAEKILRTALADRREQTILASKVGNPVGPGPEDRGLSRGHILRECDRSLARLDTDRIDLYYMHRPDPDAPLEESIAAFMELIQGGKIRHWGLSNFDAVQTREVIAICDAQHWQRPVVHQPPYSLLNRGIEQDLLPLCRQEHIAVVPYRILEGGLLTGKYQDPSAPPEGSRGMEKPDWIPLLKDATVQQQVAALARRATEQGRTLFDYVIRTTAHTPGITSIVLGVKNIGQLAAAIRALEMYQDRG